MGWGRSWFFWSLREFRRPLPRTTDPVLRIELAKAGGVDVYDAGEWRARIQLRPGGGDWFDVVEGKPAAMLLAAFRRELPMLRQERSNKVRRADRAAVAARVTVQEG